MTADELDHLPARTALEHADELGVPLGTVPSTTS
jgi:hypothetical protein